ncbi:hypothetical protein [Streptococcus salivarius]|uniref:Uncharacterized protein n=1 Tax=Streptococcus salivarius TaxID=1304 RepID=A0A074IYX2_STRSL|nr:hypothetical protein [Streptococcus salivarius]KEO45404.1 hypothetical protein DL07_01645 [Streptococcus salivarius]KEO46091.1 hypothetical protein DL08_07510 [Streptococcus salivarius]
MELTIDKRTALLDLLLSEYTIPEEMLDCVAKAIKQYATQNYSDEAINKMVNTPQSLSRGLSLLRERNGKTDLSLFRGIMLEWLVCAEYNALKNKGDVVMTIINPDPTSKADLLHIINTEHGYKVVPGPDVKSGGSTYVLNQWEKIVRKRYEIPMVDVDGVLTSDEGLKQLTSNQKARFEELCKEYPNKKPLATEWNKEDISRVLADYLKYVEFAVQPNTDTELSIADINVRNVKEKLYNNEITSQQTHDWSVFSSETRNIFRDEVESDVDIIDKVIVEEDVDVTNQVQNEKTDSEAVKQSGIKEILSETLDMTKSGVQKVTAGLKNVVKNVALGGLNWAKENPVPATIIGLAVAGVGGALVHEATKGTSDASSNSHPHVEEGMGTNLNMESEDVNDEEELDDENESSISPASEVEEDDVKPHHASKHIRTLPKGFKASPEKIATAKENGFDDLKENQTWVEEH